MIGLSIGVCLGSFLLLIWRARQDGRSLGLPIAYLALLLLNHVPGAYAHFVGEGFFSTDDFTAIGIAYTAVGSVFFVIGAELARLGRHDPPIPDFADRRKFALFCLFGGWLMLYGLAPLGRVPSLGAAIDKGSAIWILGVLLGLRYSTSRGHLRMTFLWLLALGVYPVTMAVREGFLSYGTAAVFTAGGVLAVSTRRTWRAFAGAALVAVLSVNLFVNYFSNRDSMRAVVWGHGSLAERFDANLAMFSNFKVFDPQDPSQLRALDDRLNQNRLIGIAERRLEGGQVHYLHGASVRDALLSLVPRVIWPTKPVYGGSPAIVSHMTGLPFNANTSIGVGQVMEFQCNFGLIGVVLGFIGLGYLLAFLDRKAALAEARGDLGSAIVYFLPAAALLQPIGSLVELSGGAAAALVAALGWRWAWINFGATGRRRAPGSHAAPATRRARALR